MVYVCAVQAYIHFPLLFCLKINEYTYVAALCGMNKINVSPMYYIIAQSYNKMAKVPHSSVYVKYSVFRIHTE